MKHSSIFVGSETYYRIGAISSKWSKDTMKKQWADKWVKALRSGRYKQTKKKLYDEKTGGYCCLGVLCRVAGKKFYNGNCLGEGQVLPAKVQALVGMSDKNPCLPKALERFANPPSLAELNDQGKKFSEIADIIEQNWKLL